MAVAGRVGMLAVVVGEVVVIAAACWWIGLIVSPAGAPLPEWPAWVGGAVIAVTATVAVRWPASRRAWSCWWSTGVALCVASALLVQVLLVPLFLADIITGFALLATAAMLGTFGLGALLHAWCRPLDHLVAAGIVAIVFAAGFGTPAVVRAVADTGIRWRLDLVDDGYLDDVADGHVDDGAHSFTTYGPRHVWMWGLGFMDGGVGIVLDRHPETRRNDDPGRFHAQEVYAFADCDHLRDDWYWCAFN